MTYNFKEHQLKKVEHCVYNPLFYVN